MVTRKPQEIFESLQSVNDQVSRIQSALQQVIQNVAILNMQIEEMVEHGDNPVIDPDKYEPEPVDAGRLTGGEIDESQNQ